MIKEARFSPFVEEVPVRDWINERGQEVLDNRPVNIPLPSQTPPVSIMELMHRLYKDLNNPETETFEEADDFDVADDIGLESEMTPYEAYFDRFTEGNTVPSEPTAVPSEPQKVEADN